jgi:phospholipase/carboxylesterase
MTDSRLSRRQALFAAAASGAALACRTEAEDTASESASSPLAPELKIAIGGDLGEEDRGGTMLVMLHGYGASAVDLVLLARSLVQARTRYIVPAGPIDLKNGGHAWWSLRGQPRYDENNVLLTPTSEVASARQAVLGLLAQLKREYAPESLCLLGFSQGAMLALDVALTASAGVERVAVLSGALVQDAATRAASPRRTKPAVFVSHGRQDPVLRFDGALQLVKSLKKRKFEVTFRAFDGGHVIPDEINASLREFLFQRP